MMHYIRLRTLLYMVTVAFLAMTAFSEESGEQKRAALTVRVEAGDVEAMKILAHDYFVGENGPKDSVKGQQLVFLLAESGDTYGLRQAGVYYKHGMAGVEKDLLRAYDCFSKAANNGDSNAIFELFMMCAEDDRNCSVNSQETASLLVRLEQIAQTNSFAKLQMGLVYKSGPQNIRDLKKSFYWLKQSAEEGVGAAMLEVANAYEQGLGATFNLQEAFKWNAVLAQADDVRALTAKLRLAQFYEQGIVTPVDLKKAAEYYESVANSRENARSKAMVKLAVLYFRGIETGINREMALTWIKRAEAEGTDAKRLFCEEFLDYSSRREATQWCIKNLGR